MTRQQLALGDILLAHEHISVALKEQLVGAVAEKCRYVPVCREIPASLSPGLGPLRERIMLLFPDDDTFHSKSFCFVNHYVLASIN